MVNTWEFAVKSFIKAVVTLCIRVSQQRPTAAAQSLGSKAARSLDTHLRYTISFEVMVQTCDHMLQLLHLRRCSHLKVIHMRHAPSRLSKLGDKP